MRYNKSEIMKNAWNYLNTGRCLTFSRALKLSWEDAKTEMVEATTLQPGDTIKVEYGDYGNHVKCVVTEVNRELFLDKYFRVKAVAGAVKLNFCVEPDEAIRKIAA